MKYQKLSIIHSFIYNFMKSLLYALCSFISIAAYSQNNFFVKGKIDSISDGEVVTLFRYRDGSIDGASTDTIYKGNFTLSDTATKPTLYWLLASSDKFPGEALELWAAPGITIDISGKGYLYKTWKVKSPLREQQEENRFISSSIGDWNKVQQLQIQDKVLRQQIYNAKVNVKDSLEKYRYLLNNQEDSIRRNITRREIELLQKFPVTDIWMNKMIPLARLVTYEPETPHRKTIMQLYEKIPAEKKRSTIGEKITAILFPSKIVKPGDRMVDMPLLDTLLVEHQLAEYANKGRYVLLDFWFINCGNCVMAMPETKVLCDSLKDKLTIIGVNTDETDYWQTRSKEKQISWVNLNDSKGRDGLAGSYGAEGAPHYVLISPEGIILDAWLGYEKGNLTKKVLQYIH